jgi:tRNA(adenine34) deaminase
MMTTDSEHLKFMRVVLDHAESLMVDSKEVPVAAIVVDGGQIIGLGLNSREREQSVIAHAEIKAIEAAAKHRSAWNLAGCTIYVNLEPCPMCAGAILQSHITELVFAAHEAKSGAFGSRYNLSNSKLKVYGGILEDESLKLMQKFFAKLRSNFSEEANSMLFEE